MTEPRPGPAPVADRLLVVLALLATFVTGLVDAVSFLGLDGIFSANMTGNVVMSGMGLAGAGRIPLVLVLLAVLCFISGAAAGSRFLRRSASREPCCGRGVVLLGVETLILAGVTLALLRHSEPGSALKAVLTAVLGVAMGAQAVAVRRLGVRDVSSVVVTMTMVGVAADSRLGGGSSAGTGRRVAAVTAMTAGAGTGALLLHAGPDALATAAAALLLSVITALAWRRVRKERPPADGEPGRVPEAAAPGHTARTAAGA